MRFQYTPPSGGERLVCDFRDSAPVFQYTPPSGGEPVSAYPILSCLKFQYTPPSGGERFPKSTQVRCGQGFNTRLRVEANVIEIVTSTLNSVFQYTPPSGGEHTHLIADITNILFQYTPPSGGELRFLFLHLLFL